MAPAGNGLTVARFSIEPEDVAVACRYRDTVLEQLLDEPGHGVTPAPHELMLACIAAHCLARDLDLRALRAGLDVTLELEEGGWPPVVIADQADGGGSAYLVPMVGESVLNPRPVWPILVREELVSAVTYHAYVSVWIPAHEKFAAGMPVSATGVVAGWLGPAEVATLKRVEVAPHAGGNVGGSFRQGRVAQLRSVDDLVERIARGRLHMHDH